VVVKRDRPREALKRAHIPLLSVLLSEHPPQLKGERARLLLVEQLVV
jgi:hypothetical protein